MMNKNVKVVYISNAFAHSQSAFAEELFRHYGSNFCFIQTGSISTDRKEIGSYQKRPYVIEAINKEEQCKRMCDEADIVIFGMAPLQYIKSRIEHNKLTFYYSERLFKKPFFYFLNPKSLINIFKRFLFPGKKSNFYLLCASSHASSDFKKIHAFKNRMFKWGYQPEIIQPDINSLLSMKNNDIKRYVWVGRLVKLKHCEHAISIFREVHLRDGKTRMDIIGDGPYRDYLRKLINKYSLNDSITLHGSLSIKETREYMAKANYFIFSSNYKEGWGMTLNECMAFGVICFASNQAGATDFLVKDGQNGFVYRFGKINQVIKKINELDEEEELCIARNAYNTIKNEWNIVNSVNRLCVIFDSLMNKQKIIDYCEGPCSRV